VTAICSNIALVAAVFDPSFELAFEGPLGTHMISLQKTSVSEGTHGRINRIAFPALLFGFCAGFFMPSAGAYAATDSKKSSHMEATQGVTDNLARQKTLKSSVGTVEGKSNWRGKKGRCLLKISGKKFIDGQCWVRLETGGSFQIMSLNESYIAQLLRLDGEAIGYWNETAGSTHAHATLGVMNRSGACWKNVKAEICAWSL
jgi:hypothetical protein